MKHIVFACCFAGVLLSVVFAQPVRLHGRLKVNGTQLLDKNDQPYALHGMSLGWSSFHPRFYNAGTVDWLYKDWNCSVVRAAMGVEPKGGYKDDPGGSTAKVEAVVEGAIKSGIYVIIDWHSHHVNLQEAKDFFGKMAAKYGNYPNIIYELFNEPAQAGWPEIKAYAEEVIKVIREKDPENIILVGCPKWDQELQWPAADPIKGYKNLMYTMHFYAGTHRQWLRDRTDAAIKAGLPVFISESGGMASSGDGPIDGQEWQKYVDWINRNNLSWITWSVSDKNETCSVLNTTASSTGNWKDSDIKESGLKARAYLEAYPPVGPLSIIFDTDMGPDYDDVGAITLLHAFADEGKVNILATMASTKYGQVAAVLDVLNTYFGRPGIPIGVPRGKALELKDWQHWTDTLFEKYPHAVKTNSDVPDAVTLYRKILAQQPNQSVTLVTVGFLTNLSGLLQSGGDENSPLTGKALIRQKVKSLVCMAGKFPSGYEFNMDKDIAASRYVFDNWETPVLFSGFEIGEKIKCGLPLIHNERIRNSPVKDVFRISIPQAAEDSAGRKSWDETAVLVAVNGPSPFYELENGKIVLADDGKVSWNPGNGLHHYLVAKTPAVVVQKLIDEMIMHQPGSVEHY